MVALAKLLKKVVSNPLPLTTGEATGFGVADPLLGTGRLETAVFVLEAAAGVGAPAKEVVVKEGGAETVEVAEVANAAGILPVLKNV